MNMSNSPVLRVLVVGGVLSASPLLATAADISVCPSGCSYTSVQAGIDAATAGDRVLVGTPGRTTPETYVENIMMKEGVDVVSEGNDSQVVYDDPFNVLSFFDPDYFVLNRATLTVIQGTGSTSVVRYTGINSATLDGFTVENIDDTAPDYTSLIFVGDSSPIIQNNIIRDNLGPAHNGGIQVGGGGMSVAEPLIQNNIIHYVNGHGVGITDGANPTIQDNVIFTRAVVTDYAPGIGFNGAAAATILRNEIFKNGRAGIGAVDPSFNGEGGGLAGGNAKPIIIQGNHIHGNSSHAAIRLDGKSGADVSGVNILIGGPNAEDANILEYNFAGIRMYHPDGYTNQFGSVTIQNNSITHGVGAYIHDVTDLTITGNNITNSSGACGIRMSRIHNAEINSNTITDPSYCGIRMFYAWNHTMSSLVIDHNTIARSGYAGIIIDEHVSSGSITNNTITDSGFGGLVFPAAGSYEVLNNEISGSRRGGIHTGPGVNGGVWMPTLFRGNNGELNLTIRNNSIHDNGSGDYGGGIDVRHASGVIENNLVYNNHFGGIRFGDWISSITHNTVVGNGQTGMRGAGIVFDDLEGEINADPSGSPSTPFPIRNNILANNYNAGINAGTLFSSGESCADWAGLREYNLYSENNGATTGCYGSWFPFCYYSQTALCTFNEGESNDAPAFVDAANQDFRLSTTSVAVDGGDPNSADDIALPPGEGTMATDMGAYGGPHGLTSYGNR